MGNEHGTNQRWILGWITAAAWILASVAGIGGADGPTAFLIFVGWVFNAIYVGHDSHARGMPALRWTLLAVFTGPVSTLVYMSVRPPAPAVCPSCGSVLDTSTGDCPACGHRPILGQAMSVVNQVIAGLSDSLTTGPIDKARHTAKHMSAALGALAAFTYLLVLGRYHGPASGFVEFLWVVSAAAYWVLLPWWVYLDAKWRRMDAMPWAVLTLVTNVFGLVTYLVIRYPDPRVCPQCRAYLTVGLKRCPYCGSEAEPTCPRCQAPIKTDWIFCPSCAAQLPCQRTSDTVAEETQQSGPPSLLVRGTVADAVTGSPIAGAVVKIDSRSRDTLASTDALGRYAMTDLEPQPYVLLASAPGYTSEAKAYHPDALGNAQLHFSLYPVSGRMEASQPDEGEIAPEHITAPNGGSLTTDQISDLAADRTASGWLRNHFEKYKRLSPWEFCWRITLEGLLVSLVLAIPVGLLIGDQSGLSGLSVSEFVAFAVIIAPPVETVLLQVLPVFLARLVRLGFAGQVMASMIPFAGLHFLNGPTSGIAAGLGGGFYFAFTYVHWRQTDTRTAFWVTCLSHTMHNLALVPLLALA